MVQREIKIIIDVTKTNKTIATLKRIALATNKAIIKAGITVDELKF